MTDTFFSESVKAADEYIKSISIIDDEPDFSNDVDRDHSLSANRITKAFAESGKACTIFKIQDINDKSNILKLVKATDVCILDWRINLPPVCTRDITEEEGEEDVEDTAGRGKHAIDLLKAIIAESDCAPKLIIVYTGEREAEPIFSEILKLFNNVFESDKEDLWVQNENYRVVIRFKPALKNAVDPAIKSKYIDYMDLPDVISQEFAKLTGGLISNAAISSIAILRNNTNKLLQEYNKQLDLAYLTHRAMCPEPEDAEELILENIIGSISSILTCENTIKYCDINRVKLWLDNYAFSPTELEINKKRKVSVTLGLLKEWMECGAESCLRKNLKEKSADINDLQWEQYERGKLKKDIQSIFSPDNNINEEFAILSHHKSNFYREGYSPKLTLGSIIRPIKSEMHLLCIQQRCDSVRIASEEKRSFMFLPLEKQDKKFSFLYKDKEGNYIQLKEKLNCQDLKTISFKAANNGIVTADNSIFIDAQNNKYEWVLDLKDSYAQKIANKFAAMISRVGIDESEWLRRS